VTRPSPALTALLTLHVGVACSPKRSEASPSSSQASAEAPRSGAGLAPPSARPPSDPATSGSSTATTTGVEDDASAAEQAASPTQARMVEALSPRDGRPPCIEIEALSPTPVADLTWVALNVSMPPWVGLEAATCLITGHSAEARPTLEAWLTDPALEGFGLLILTQLDALPLDTALALAQLALDKGPNPDRVKSRLKRSKKPEIKALAGP
jgi:hypothetical protein